MSWYQPLCFHLLWDSVIPGLVCLFPSRLGKFSIIFFHINFQFSSLFSFRQPHNVNVGPLEVVTEIPYAIIIFLNPFFFFLMLWLGVFACLYSKLLIWLSSSSVLLLIPYTLFFFQLLYLSFSDRFFFFMVAMSFLYAVEVPPKFIYCFPKFIEHPYKPVFWILHLIDCLSSFFKFKLGTPGVPSVVVEPWLLLVHQWEGFTTSRSAANDKKLKIYKLFFPTKYILYVLKIRKLFLFNFLYFHSVTSC